MPLTNCWPSRRRRRSLAMRSRDAVTRGRCDGVTLSDVIGRRRFGGVFQARVGVGHFALAKAMDQLAPHSEL